MDRSSEHGLLLPSRDQRFAARAVAVQRRTCRDGSWRATSCVSRCQGGDDLLRSRIVTDPKSVFSIRPEVDAIRPARPHSPALAASRRRLDRHRLASHDGRRRDQRPHGSVERRRARRSTTDRNRSRIAPRLAFKSDDQAVEVPRSYSLATARMRRLMAATRSAAAAR